MITDHEKEIITRARNTADTFGLSRISVAKDIIIDEGYKWTEEHELFIFNYNGEIK